MAWNNDKPRPPARRKPVTGIAPDSPAGRMLQALRAGRMTSAELAERIPGYSNVTSSLAARGLILRPSGEDGYWQLTDAGRAACPLRNPLAAHVVAPRPGSLARCASSNTPATTATIPARLIAGQPNTTHPQEGLMPKLQPIADAIKAAIAGVTKANAISREDLVSRANQADAPRSTLNKVFSALTEEGDVLGAHGATVARRFYDARTERGGRQEGQPGEAGAERMQTRQAVTAAIAGRARDRAIDKDALINAASLICDASRPQIADMIKRMAAEATVVGAEGQTNQRRYFDIRTLQTREAAPPVAVVQADPVVEIKVAAPVPKVDKPAAPHAAAPPRGRPAGRRVLDLQRRPPGHHRRRRDPGAAAGRHPPPRLFPRLLQHDGSHSPTSGRLKGAAMSKKPRIKSTASAVPVPQAREGVADYIREIGQRQRELTRLEADMNDEIAKVKERFEGEAEPHRQRIASLQAGAQIWCEANRDQLTQGGKVKTATFTTGEIQWRTRPPSVRITGAEAVLDLLRRLGLTRFIRQKEEVNKEAILNEPEAVAHVAGIGISQGEDFIVVPFEAELAGEAA